MVRRREIVFGLCILLCGFVLVWFATEPHRAEKRSRSCFSNLQRIGLALAQYSQDYNDTLPRTWFGSSAGPSDAKVNYKWMDAIFPYVKAESAFTCSEDHANKPYRLRSGTNYGSYVMNNAYYLPGDNLTPPAGLDLSQISAPHTTVLLTDGLGDFQFTWPDIKGTPPPFSANSPHLGTILGRHWKGNDTSARPLCLGSDFASFSTLYNFHQRTATKNGQTFYAALTIEND